VPPYTELHPWGADYRFSESFLSFFSMSVTDMAVKEKLSLPRENVPKNDNLHIFYVTFSAFFVILARRERSKTQSADCA
jgi:hypothetical protein